MPIFHGMCQNPTGIIMSNHGNVTLRDCYKKKLSFDVLYEIFIQTAKILREIHSRSIVHNDVKDNNICVSYEKDVKVTLVDYGLARHIGEMIFEKSVDPVEAEFIRREYYPHYAPEAFQGEPSSPESDVYSLGFTIKMALLGRRPCTSLKHILRRCLLEKHLRPSLSELITELSFAKDATRR